MLKINKLSKNYGEKRILDNISFNVNKGEIIALLGSSGSGKSTLLRCIAGLEKYDGSIYLSGNLKKGKVAMIFQHFNLFNNMTVLQNLMYAQINVLHRSTVEALDQALYWLDKVNLTYLKDFASNKISGGQKQRVAIARALCMDPEVILFDEPTSALDPENVQEVLKLISSLSNLGITMLIVTHAMKFASKTASRVLFLDSGKLTEDTDALTFFNQPSTSRASIFLNTFLNQ
jgi:ABC-type polar amino acid transport system ATPase subunit